MPLRMTAVQRRPPRPSVKLRECRALLGLCFFDGVPRFRRAGCRQAFSQGSARLGRSWAGSVSEDRQYRSFREFYPFYLSEHANSVSRRLHFTGTSIALALILAAIATQTWWLAAIALVEGYAFAWVGHFFFEHNKPATFKYPGFSLMGDWRLWWDILTGRQKF